MSIDMVMGDGDGEKPKSKGVDGDGQETRLRLMLVSNQLVESSSARTAITKQHPRPWSLALHLLLASCSPMVRPQIFPELPEREELFDDRIHRARDLIAASYNAASNLLLEEISDSIRLQIHAQRLSTRFLPLLEALERDLQDQEWIAGAVRALLDLINDLNLAAQRVASMYVQDKIYMCLHLIRCLGSQQILTIQN